MEQEAREPTPSAQQRYETDDYGGVGGFSTLVYVEII